MERRAIDVAKYVISKCTIDKRPVSNLQLQKILYYIQVAFYKNFKRPCFSDNFEAWMFGPVVPEVYYQYCGAGAYDIVLRYPESYGIWETETEKQIVDKIISEKREMNPWDLVNDTHKEGKAWAQTYRKGEGNKQIIDKELIQTNG